MSLINDISNLAMAQATVTYANVNERALAIKGSLYDLKQTLPAHSADRDDLFQIAETKRLTALLYLTETLSRTLDQTSLTQQQYTSSIRHLMTTIIRQISSLPDSATLLWPLFVLGNSGSVNEDHRRFVLDRLGRLQKTRNLGSVRRARMAVKKAFQMVDLDSRGRSRWSAETIGCISLA